MRLADRIAQCRAPFLVQSTANKTVTRLTGAADFTQDILKCPTRYILCDDLTRLCTALAYSKGARTLACADLLHVPAERVWVEWCEAPWLDEVSQYGFRLRRTRADCRPPRRLDRIIAGWSTGFDAHILVDRKHRLGRACQQHGGLFRSGHRRWRRARCPGPPRSPDDQRIRPYPRQVGYFAPLLSFQIREHVGRLLRTRVNVAAGEGCSSTPRARHDRDRHPDDLGVLPDAGHPPQFAAPSAHARTAQPIAVQVGERAPPRSDRSILAGRAGISALHRRFIGRHPARAETFTTCAGISCDAAAKSSGVCHICEGTPVPEPFTRER